MTGMTIYAAARLAKRALLRATMLSGGFAGAALMIPAGTAFAQADVQDEEVQAEQIDENVILVSARRKVETLTEIPSSITSYSSEFLERQNVTSFVDYASKVPNLSFQPGQGGSNLWAGDRETAIRGVAGKGTTSFYIDDTPVPSSVSPQVLNLDRIEVLKGPQGTLFGASSMGGNLRYITRKPSFTDDDGTVSVQGGFTKDGGFDYDANFRKNTVLVEDRLALNVAAGYLQDSGFITRRFPDSTGSLVSKDDEGRNRVLSGSVALRARLTDTLEVTASFIGQRSRLNGFPGAYLPLPDYRPVSYTIYRDTDVQEFSNDDWGLGALVFNYAGDGFDIVSSSSFFARKIVQVDDNTEGTNGFFNDFFELDFSGVPFTVEIDARTKAYTHETRLSFEEGAVLPGLSGIFGVFHQYQRQKDANPGIFVQELEDAGFDPPYLAEVRARRTEKNTALFGELYLEPVEGLTFTGGLRQYWITQREDPSVDKGALFEPGGFFNAERTARQSGLVPKAVVSYEIGDQGNIYASVAKGFRVGGTNFALPPFCGADLDSLGLTFGEVGQFGSDSLWSYEVGAKSRLADGRISASAAAFHMDWSDIQQVGQLPSCGLTFITNAGKARIRGGELEIGGRPLANVPLSIQLGLGYLNAKLTDPGVLPQPAGSPLGLVPEWTASISGYYETPISQNADFFIASDYSYTSSTTVPSVTEEGAEFFTRQPINLVNANFGVKFGRAQVMIYGKNLLDNRLTFGDQPISGFERYEMVEGGGFSRLPRGPVTRPRQVGMQLRLDF
ncbi:TonB-dependent receptor [Aurantiacibacter rhizosphaerae]|nr:TonB-dependent receptor [Aurantiacibacter rhizosphaerae]